MKNFAFKKRILSHRNLRFLTFILLLSFAPSAHAVIARNCVSQLLHSIVKPTLETPVELELDINHEHPQALRLLTTSDGTVGTLSNKLPSWFETYAHTEFPLEKDFKKIPWDELDPEVQRMLVQQTSATTAHSFFENRKVPGLITKQKIKIHFKKPTEFFGKNYSSGTYMIDLSTILQPTVEYKSAGHVHDFSGIEVHLRAQQPAGAMNRYANIFLEGLDLPPTHKHVHILSEVTLEALNKEPVLESALATEFVRRSNLAAEMISVVNEGSTIGKTEAGGVLYFDSLSPHDLKGVTQYFLDRAHGIEVPISDEYKMAWVGMRGSDKYDKPNLWAIEVRSVPIEEDADLYENFLNGLQTKMLTESYGVSREQMKEWIQLNRRGRSIPQVMADTWYNQPWSQLYANAPASLKNEYRGLSGWVKKLKIKNGSREDRALKMLLHDWSNDPLIFYQPELKAKILAAQRRGILNYHATGTSNSAVAYFLEESGLYEEVMKSVGVQVQLKPRTLRAYHGKP